jgi:hypothetical protein
MMTLGVVKELPPGVVKELPGVLELPLTTLQGMPNLPSLRTLCCGPHLPADIIVTLQMMPALEPSFLRRHCVRLLVACRRLRYSLLASVLKTHCHVYTSRSRKRPSTVQHMWRFASRINRKQGKRPRTVGLLQFALWSSVAQSPVLHSCVFVRPGMLPAGIGSMPGDPAKLPAVLCQCRMLVQ